MLLIFIMVTYFNACAFFYLSTHLNSSVDVFNGNTFVKAYEFDKEDFLMYLLRFCYYTSTTVNIIGYGEMTPKSNIEKVWHIYLMFVG
jgi:hypothetical protein